MTHSFFDEQVVVIAKVMRPELFKYDNSTYDKTKTHLSWKNIRREQLRTFKMIKAVLLAQEKAGFEVQISKTWAVTGAEGFPKYERR